MTISFTTDDVNASIAVFAQIDDLGGVGLAPRTFMQARFESGWPIPIVLLGDARDAMHPVTGFRQTANRNQPWIGAVVADTTPLTNRAADSSTGLRSVTIQREPLSLAWLAAERDEMSSVRYRHCRARHLTFVRFVGLIKVYGVRTL